ncbi:MAG: hypothetical protein IJY93_02125 [Clostridia bacterium]|nr:hypothetical protein [Clostridia bacterium]
MKKFFEILLLAVVVSGLGGCSGRENVEPDDNPTDAVNVDTTVIMESDNEEIKEYLLLKQTNYYGNGEISGVTDYYYKSDGKIGKKAFIIYYDSGTAKEFEKWGHSAEPYGQEEIYNYDENGNHVSSEVYDLDGVYLGYNDYEYNSDDQIIKYEFYSDGILDQQEIYSYNQHGDEEAHYHYLRESTKTEYKYTYTYNSSGNKISRYVDFKGYKMGESTPKWEWSCVDETYEYNDKNQLVKKYYSTNDYNKSVTEYKYDSDGTVVKEIILKDGIIDSWIEYEYILLEDIVVNDTEITNFDENKEQMLSDFCNMAEGIYVNLDEVIVDGLYKYADFFAFDGGEFYFGVFASYCDRKGQIVDIEKDGDVYNITLYFPATVMYDEYYDEEYTDIRLVFGENCFSFEGDAGIYTYMGATINEAESNVFSMEYTETNNPTNDFINNKKPIIDFDTKITTSVKDLSSINSNYMGNPSRWTSVDLDGDGEEEILVEYNAMGDTAIIHRKGNDYYAYYMPYRGITNLKTDGTSDWSNSAFESGVHRLIFTDEGIVSEEIIVFNTQENIFIVDGINVSETECSNALAVQNNKKDVEWYSID